MSRRYLSLAVSLPLLLATSNVFAAAPVTAKVTYVGTYGDGRLFIGLDTPINETGCVNSRIDVPMSHPQAKNWMALATTASVSGKSITVTANGCFGGYPTMSQDTASWLYVMQ